MNAASLSAARDDLSAALRSTGYQSLAHVPESVVPPCLIVQAGDPYISVDDTTFDQSDFLMTVELFILADYQANEQATNKLDEMLTHVLPAVLAAGWSIAGAGAPGPYNTTDWIAYGVRVSLSRFVLIDPTP